MLNFNPNVINLHYNLIVLTFTMHTIKPNVFYQNKKVHNSSEWILLWWKVSHLLWETFSVYGVTGKLWLTSGSTLSLTATVGKKKKKCQEDFFFLTWIIETQQEMLYVIVKRYEKAKRFTKSFKSLFLLLNKIICNICLKKKTKSVKIIKV